MKLSILLIIIGLALVLIFDWLWVGWILVIVGVVLGLITGDIEMTNSNNSGGSGGGCSSCGGCGGD
jgi:Zn-dependent membrane protease YugP